MASRAERRLAPRVALLALLAAALMSPASSPARGTTWESVIVSGVDGATGAVGDAVTSVGGVVDRVLPIIDGVSAKVPADSLPALRGLPGVRAVTPDASGRLLGIDSQLGYDVTGDEGSLYYAANVMRAKDAAWNKGYTGRGVDIALIDSGVAPVTGMTSGNVIHGPDLSFESQNPDLRQVDTYGHGTHMASIIVGRDVAGTGPSYTNANSHRFNGIAPDSRLISLKVATNSGAADVSQIIAAIDWVTQNKTVGNLNIKVLNLSYGTNSSQSFAIDPLAYAVENAWRAGIVVVVAGGNNGTSRTELTSPAYDPLVIAAGADDTNKSTSTSDDRIASFSQPGTPARHLDLIAPGLHILGLRVPGSRLDQNNPQAVVNNRFFRGTGSSQAAAMTSGAAALYLSKYPNATPDQVKRVLMTTASMPVAAAQVYPGLGVPNLNAALGLAPYDAEADGEGEGDGTPSRDGAAQAATGAVGTGSLEAARGGAHVNDGVADLTGERDIFGNAWDGQSWSTGSSQGNTWTGGSWNGTTWTGTTWTGGAWNGTTWTGNTWTGNTWTGTTWTGNTWTGNTWTGGGWTGNTWTGNTWTGNTWTSSAVWAGETWD